MSFEIPRIHNKIEADTITTRNEFGTKHSESLDKLPSSAVVTPGFLLSMVSKGTNPLWCWPIYSLIGFIAMIIQIVIIYKELKKRKSEHANVIFISKWLRIFSTICLVCGVLVGFCAMVQLLPGTCFLAWHIKHILIQTQVVTMGLFQLSRLYYCFSQSNTYTHMGYSNKLFIVMYGIGIAILLTSTTTVWFKVPKYCGFDQEFRFVFVETHHIIPNWIFSAIESLVYIIWDWTTLGLYIHKLRQCLKLNKTKPNTSDNNKVRNEIEDRVRSILARITICTCLYESVFIAFIVIVVIQVFVPFGDMQWNIHELFSSLTTISYSYGMVLMLEHNDTEYQTFLKYIYYVCYCFRSQIGTELYMDELHLSNTVNQSSSKRSSDSTQKDHEVSYNTNDISQDHGKIGNIEMSVQTIDCNKCKTSLEIIQN